MYATHLRDVRANLGADAARLRGLMHNDEPASLVDALRDRLKVVRRDGPQVDELDAEVAQRFRHERRELGRGVTEHVQGLLDDVEWRAPGDDGQIRALAQDLGLVERQGVVADGHVLLQRAVEDLGLEDEDWIGIEHGRAEQALCLNGRARDDRFDAGRVLEEGFDRLAVVERAVPDAHAGCAEGQAGEVVLPVSVAEGTHTHHATRPIAELGRLVDDLIERGQDVCAVSMQSPVRLTCNRRTVFRLLLGGPWRPCRSRSQVQVSESDGLRSSGPAMP